MRILKRSVLLGTVRPHRYAPEAEAAQQIADRSLGQLDPVALLDHKRQVDPAPAHHAVDGQIGASPNQLRHLPCLLGGQTRLRSRRRAVRKPLYSLGVVTVHPIAQRLTVHAAGRRRLAP
jgi:hypothetical protein